MRAFVLGKFCQEAAMSAATLEVEKSTFLTLRGVHV